MSMFLGIPRAMRHSMANAERCKSFMLQRSPKQQFWFGRSGTALPLISQCQGNPYLSFRSSLRSSKVPSVLPSLSSLRYLIELEWCKAEHLSFPKDDFLSSGSPEWSCCRKHKTVTRCEAPASWLARAPLRHKTIMTGPTGLTSQKNARDAAVIALSKQWQAAGG